MRSYQQPMCTTPRLIVRTLRRRFKPQFSIHDPTKATSYSVARILEPVKPKTQRETMCHTLTCSVSSSMIWQAVLKRVHRSIALSQRTTWTRRRIAGQWFSVQRCMRRWPLKKPTVGLKMALRRASTAHPKAHFLLSPLPCKHE